MRCCIERPRTTMSATVSPPNPARMRGALSSGIARQYGPGAAPRTGATSV